MEKFSRLVQVCCSSLREWRQLVPRPNLSTVACYSFSRDAFLYPFTIPSFLHCSLCLISLFSQIKMRRFLFRVLSPSVLALPQLHHLIPDGELTSIKITRQDPSDPLAISIVGGNETPLVRILIQDIYREGVIARDGRLLPGDMILKV